MKKSVKTKGLAELSFELMPTTPPENLMGDRLDEWIKRWRHIRSQLGRSLVADHKKKLGTQAYTFNGSEFRFWVWEKLGKWRVFVSDFKGLCFEVPEGSTPDEAFDSFDDYCKAMGIKSS